MLNLHFIYLYTARASASLLHFTRNLCIIFEKCVKIAIRVKIVFRFHAVAALVNVVLSAFFLFANLHAFSLIFLAFYSDILIYYDISLVGLFRYSSFFHILCNLFRIPSVPIFLTFPIFFALSDAPCSYFARFIFLSDELACSRFPSVISSAPHPPRRHRHLSRRYSASPGHGQQLRGGRPSRP